MSEFDKLRAEYEDLLVVLAGMDRQHASLEIKQAYANQLRHKLESMCPHTETTSIHQMSVDVHDVCGDNRYYDECDFCGAKLNYSWTMHDYHRMRAAAGLPEQPEKQGVL